MIWRRAPRPPRDVATLVGDLVATLDRAKPVPLTDQVRVDRRKIESTLAELDGAIGAEGASLDAATAAALREAGRALTSALGEARPVPLTNEVRLPRERLDSVADELRRHRQRHAQ